MKLKVALLSVLVGTGAFAVQGYNASGLSLGHFSKVKCSTGLTCTNSAGMFNIVSSPTLATALTLAGIEGADSAITLSADESDDNGDDWKIASVAATNSFVLSNDTSGSLVAKFTLTTAGNLSLVGTLTGDGGDALSGFLQKQVAATATTITAAQCGSTFINTGAVQMELPEASAVLGCRLTFITGNASNFDLNPDNADQILVQTNAVGDATRNATLGNSITLEAISASQWTPVAISGTWSDIN